MTKKQIFILLAFLFSTTLFAQDYKKLDEDIYLLHFSEKPFDTIKILKNEIPVKLPAGKYDVPRNKITGRLSQVLVSIDERGLVAEDIILKTKTGRVT